MKRFKDLYKQKRSKLLNIYFTAGHPYLESTVPIIQLLAKQGADIIEIGMPYSDPLADGLTIQQSSKVALNNGMKLSLLFEQVKAVRSKVDTPIILMGYLNQMMQYGEDKFLSDASSAGVDGFIIPDLPMAIYENSYKEKFELNGLGISFLITPETSTERVIQADRLSTSFLYMVSKSAITGNIQDLQEKQVRYFKRISNLDLASIRLIGFGIHDAKTLKKAWSNSNGAIIGSAFIRAIDQPGQIEDNIHDFFQKLDITNDHSVSSQL